jgi:ankyrin repeat protein
LTDPKIVLRALHWSVEAGRAELVRRILEHPEIDVNAKVRGDTALYMACHRGGSRDTIVALMEAGADPTILCDGSGSEFGGMGHARCIYSSPKDGVARGYTSLSALCAQSRGGYREREFKNEDLPELFALLIAKGANVHQQTPEHRTALHLAVNNPTLVKLLLNAGADANCVDRDGLAPLHSTTNAVALALLVEEGGADINIVGGRERRSPLLCVSNVP